VITLIVLLVVGLIVLIISTDQFVTGASIVAKDLRVSPILVGAVILGCGTGLPELALAFYGSHQSPWRQVLQLEGPGGQGMGFLLFFLVLTVILVLPILFPDKFKSHSPLILMGTIAFASLLRGSLDRYEGAAMLVGFAVGVAWIIHDDRRPDDDPFADIIEDDYAQRSYIEEPIMTPIQVGLLRSMCGLLGTAIGAQVLAFSALQLLKNSSYDSDVMRNIIFVSLGSLLPHVVVALQALRQHHEGLAVGNLIGSSLFNSLVIGGLVAIIRPYQPGGHFNPLTLAVIATSALLSWMMLSTRSELSRKQGVALLAAYAGLVFSTVL
jgi:cation:H+ antiporter